MHCQIGSCDSIIDLLGITRYKSGNISALILYGNIVFIFALGIQYGLVLKML